MRYSSLTQAENSRATLLHCIVLVPVQCRSCYKRSGQETTNHPQPTEVSTRVGIWCHQPAASSDAQSKQRTRRWRVCSSTVAECFHQFCRLHKKQGEEIISIDSETPWEPRIRVAGFNVWFALYSPLQLQSSALICSAAAVKLWWQWNELSRTKLLKVLFFALR